MVEKVVTAAKIIEFARFQEGRAAAKVPAISNPVCRYCGAVLLDGENEDECSSTSNVGAASLRASQRRFYADGVEAAVRADLTRAGRR